MTKAPENVEFALEVNNKFNELIAWVLQHSPAQDEGLKAEDFAQVREKFYQIACGIGAQSTEPEPSEGGVQYVNVTPAPWP
jgi:hypothetical protein